MRKNLVFVPLLALVSALTLPFAQLGTAAHASPSEATASVVSVLPVWPGRAQGGAGAPPGVAPEGSGIVLPSGMIATAWHVIEPADRIDVRLPDGRILPAQLIAQDITSDVALLSVEANLPGFEIAPRPALADRACAIGNAWGLGVSVTCGVVSALDVTQAGFNEIEHFVQTDAAANPGVSGGALVDDEGRLIGMMSAIFASQGDTNIGVNFAVSTDLLLRVTDALIRYGEVTYPNAGWRLRSPGRDQLAQRAAALVVGIEDGSAAALAGLLPGDLLTQIGDRRIRTPQDATAALALLAEGTSDVEVGVQRNGQPVTVTLLLTGVDATASVGDVLGDCPHPAPVCQMRQGVFPITSFDPVGSATRIGPNLLVTSRHVVADRTDAVVHTPDGPRGGRVVPSAYAGDLALIEVDGLPEAGRVVVLDDGDGQLDTTYAIGADVSRQEVRVFDPGGLIALPFEGSDLGRIHVTSYMQPGVSGGALVDAQGQVLGINAGGGEGRFEAIPAQDVRALLALRDAPDAQDITLRLGTALARCAEMMDAHQASSGTSTDLPDLAQTCAASQNHGQLLEAGRVLAMAGDFDAAIALHAQAVTQVPNSLNARISLLVSLQLAARFTEMTDHARRAMALAPDDPQVLRFGIQSGVWGDDAELAEEAYAALLKANPIQAEAARRFIDNAPPAPQRR